MTSVTPPVGWTDDEDCLHTAYYWPVVRGVQSDKPHTVRGALEKLYNLSNIVPIWTCDPDGGEVLFILQGNNSKELRYYLWNGLEDTVAQFVEDLLENVKNEIDLGNGSLKNVRFKDVE